MIGRKILVCLPLWARERPRGEHPWIDGKLRGAEGDRTPYLLTASQALSQLSYSPVNRDAISTSSRSNCLGIFSVFRTIAREERVRQKPDTSNLHAEGVPAWGGDPKKRRFLGRGGACRPVMTKA